MTNIFEFIKKQEQKDSMYLDKKGDFIPESKLKKLAFREYNQKVKSGDLDPLKTSFSDYLFKSFLKDYTSMYDLHTAIATLTGLLD